MITYLMVALGGALGSVARFWMSGAIAERFDSKFPWGTIFVMGICGGYTTFSAFSVQTLDLMRAGNWPAVTGNVLGSVLACLLAVWELNHVGQSFIPGWIDFTAKNWML